VPCCNAYLPCLFISDLLFLVLTLNFSEAEVREQMEINFYGPLRATQAMLPGFRAQGRGEVVLISSGAGYVDSIFEYIY
jgi:short-subunit dehydrogenase